MENGDQGSEIRGFGAQVLRTFFLVCLLPACGFHSVYGHHDGEDAVVADQLNQVAIDSIADRPGQLLRNDLIDRFYGKAGRPSQPLYHLTVKIRTVEENLGTLANNTTALADVQIYGDYALKDMHDKVLMSGTTHSTASYDILTSMYGTQAAHDSAIERTVREVSEQLTARLGLYFSEPKKDDQTNPETP